MKLIEDRIDRLPYGIPAVGFVAHVTCDRDAAAASIVDEFLRRLGILMLFCHGRAAIDYRGSLDSSSGGAL